MTSLELIVSAAALFGGAAAFAFLLEPFIIQLALAAGAVDVPDWRRVHKGSIPRAGGLVFLPCVAVGVIVVYNFWPELWRERYLALLGALILITVSGLWDDLKGLRPITKLSHQLLAGCILFFGDYRLGSISVPFVNIMPVETPGYADFVATVLGVAAIINALNMLDGLDGLAAGSFFIMSAFLFINKVGQGALDATAMLVLAGGATLGFLWYNFHPAKVFMGDTGSMFLGLLLAAEVFDSASQGTAIAAILLPLVILGIPVLDMLRTMSTRFWISHNIFAADKSHLHHRLLNLGLSHRQAVFFIYGLNMYMGVMALLYQHVTPGWPRSLYLLALALFVFLASFLIFGNNKARAGSALPPPRGDAL